MRDAVKDKEHYKKLRALEYDVERLNQQLERSKQRLQNYREAWKRGKLEIQTSRGQVTLVRSKSLKRAAELEKGFMMWLRMMIGKASNKHVWLCDD